MTHSTLAVRAATGLMGVTDSFDSLSFRDWEDKERDADERPNAGRVANIEVWRGVVHKEPEWPGRARLARCACDAPHARLPVLCFRHHPRPDRALENTMFVSVWVSSPDTRSERRFDLHLTVGSLKVG